MKTNFVTVKLMTAALMLLLACSGNKHASTSTSLSGNPEANAGWKLGAQAYTFNRFTFFQALDKIDSCGLRYVEAFPGQKIGGDMDGNMDYNMDAAKREKILQRLKEKHITLVSYGVVGPEVFRSESERTQLFEFAKAMGLENITAEPDEKDLPAVSALCDKYKINIALHNHPAPSHYWSPDTVLRAIKGLSNRVGSCSDIGHWVRSGLDPVECLKKLNGHVKQLHFKDLNVRSRDAHDVPWGTGVSNVDGVIAELKRQNFKGLLSAEYEYHWENSVPDVTASVHYFREAFPKIK